MTDGKETRAAIDTETVKGLLLINGGGAVALLGFLASIIDKPHLSSLAAAVIFSVFAFQLGLATAVIHNRFRRMCADRNAPGREPPPKCSFFGRELKRPCICHWSTWMLWTSISAYLIASMTVLFAGLAVLT